MLDKSYLKENNIVEILNFSKLQIEHYTLVYRIEDNYCPYWIVKIGNSTTTTYTEDELMEHFSVPYSNKNIEYSAWKIVK